MTLMILVLASIISSFHCATTSLSTPLCDAVKDKNLVLVKKLLSDGSDPNEQCNFMGFSYPLDIAATNGVKSIAKALIKAGVKVDSVNNLGETPSLIAANYLRYEVLSVLLTNGASIDVIGRFGQNLMTKAVMGYIESCLLLTEAEKVRAQRNLYHTVDVLFNMCFDVRADGEFGSGRLMDQNFMDEAEYIVKKGLLDEPDACKKND